MCLTSLCLVSTIPYHHLRLLRDKPHIIYPYHNTRKRLLCPVVQMSAPLHLPLMSVPGLHDGAVGSIGCCWETPWTFREWSLWKSLSPQGHFLKWDVGLPVPFFCLLPEICSVLCSNQCKPPSSQWSIARRNWSWIATSRTISKNNLLSLQVNCFWYYVMVIQS